MRIVESAITEAVADGVQMITTINRNIGRHRQRAVTTIIYSVRRNNRERWRSEIPVLSHNWKDRRNTAREQERIAYGLIARNYVMKHKQHHRNAPREYVEQAIDKVTAVLLELAPQRTSTIHRRAAEILARKVATTLGPLLTIECILGLGSTSTHSPAPFRWLLILRLNNVEL